MGVASAELVTEFVGEHLEVTRLVDRERGRPRDAATAATAAQGVELRDAAGAAAAVADDVADLVVGGADDVVEVGVVLIEHRERVAIGVGVVGAVEVVDQALVGDQYEARGEVALVPGVDLVDARDDVRGDDGDVVAFDAGLALLLRFCPF